MIVGSQKPALDISSHPASISLPFLKIDQKVDWILYCNILFSLYVHLVHNIHLVNMKPQSINLLEINSATVTQTEGAFLWHREVLHTSPHPKTIPSLYTYSTMVLHSSEIVIFVFGKGFPHTSYLSLSLREVIKKKTVMKRSG